MKKNKKFKAGDKIVHFGRVYRIFKIKREKVKDKKETIIFFRPYFKNKQNKSLIFSIPEDNINKTNTRKPISKKRLKELLKELSKKSEVKTPIDIPKAREKLNLNDPDETVQILRRFLEEKNDESINFSKSKQDLLRLAEKRLIQEIAFVIGASLATARKKLQAAIERK